MVFFDSIWKDYTDTGRIKVSYIVFYQGGTIDDCTHFPGPVSKYSAESEYIAAFTAGMALAHFRVLNNEFLNNDTDVVPEQAPLIILDRKSSVCMANNIKYIKHTRHISRRMHFVRNFGEWDFKIRCGVREVCNYQTSEPRMLGETN